MVKYTRSKRQCKKSRTQRKDVKKKGGRVKKSESVKKEGAQCKKYNKKNKIGHSGERVE